MADVMLAKRDHVHIRSDNGADTQLVRKAGVEDALHSSRRPMGDWLMRSFNGKLRDECLNGEI